VTGLVDLIGGTPLVTLVGASRQAGCRILGKAEFMNPGQSVKDRAALAMIREAERTGALGPGGHIVEGTAGNTGIGLAMVGNALGYRTTIVMPRSQSEEKKSAIRALGASLVEVDPAPYSTPGHYVHVSRRLADEMRANTQAPVFWAGQFDNVANREAHRTTTGPEIWQQTAGAVDGFVCAVGSGGTLAGVAQALRARRPDCVIALCDPPGAALHSYFTTGILAAEGTSIAEGIGQSRITANLEGLRVDRSYQIPDQEWLPILFDLVQHEGLCVGASAALNVAGAIRLAHDLGPGKTIVTILCDSGLRYRSKLFNRAFLTSRGLPVAEWLDA